LAKAHPWHKKLYGHIKLSGHIKGTNESCMSKISYLSLLTSDVRSTASLEATVLWASVGGVGGSTRGGGGGVGGGGDGGGGEGRRGGVQGGGGNGWGEGREGAGSWGAVDEEGARGYAVAKGGAWVRAPGVEVAEEGVERCLGRGSER